MNKSFVIFASAALGFLAGWLYSTTTQAAEFASTKPLLLRAIDAPDGRAGGTITGQIADKFRQTTGSAAPVIAEVTTLKAFKQEGCKRLNLRVSQVDVPTKEGKLVPFGIDYGINLCRDGRPPVDK